MSKKINYKKLRATLKLAGLEKWEIDSRIREMKDMDGWKPITFAQLEKMSEKELGQLYSYCWHDGSYRCDCIGISNLRITKEGSEFSKIEFSDETGDPTIYGPFKGSDKVHKVGDGEWNYGLYVKIKTK